MTNQSGCQPKHKGSLVGSTVGSRSDEGVRIGYTWMKLPWLGRDGKGNQLLRELPGNIVSWPWVAAMNIITEQRVVWFDKGLHKGILLQMKSNYSALWTSSLLGCQPCSGAFCARLFATWLRLAHELVVGLYQCGLLLLTRAEEMV